MADFTQSALPHFANGTLKTIVDRVYSLDEISEAHKAMEQNVNAGKILLKVRNENDEHSEL